MATKNIVPRADTEGSIGTTAKKWGGIQVEGDIDLISDGAGKCTIKGEGAASDISIVSEHTAGVALHIDCDANAGSIVDIDSGVIEIDTAASISIDSVDDSNYTITGSGKSLTLNAVGGGASQQAIVQSAGTGAAACAITSTAGGITLDAETDIIIDANGGDITFKDDGTSLAAVDANGQLTAKNYRTIWVGAGAMSPAATNGAGTSDFEL